jgi:hypothetical protein
MTTRSEQIFYINGVISTNKTVLQNLQTLSEACASFLTFDINTGRWCVVINQTGSYQATFNDSNTIGGITVSGTGLNEFYNQVRVDFPHKDLLDQTDTIIEQISTGDLYAHEYENVLNLRYDIINDPVQAELLGAMQLKQSRIDQIVRFETDFSMIGLKAGDIIRINSSIYGFSNKLFRIITIEETDADDGAINLSITALEYSSSIYDTTGLERLMRTPRHGIVQKNANTAIATSNDQNTGTQIMRMLIPLALSSLFDMIFSKNPLTGVVSSVLKPKADLNEGTMISQATIEGASTVCKGDTLTYTITYACCVKDDTTVPYSISGVSASAVGVPLTGKLKFKGRTSTINIPITADGVVEAPKTLTFEVGGSTGCSVKTTDIQSRGAYTMSASRYPTGTITEGNNVSITLTTTGLSTGTTVPYTITGDATYSAPAASGNVTINSSGTASFTIYTTDVDAYSDKTLTVSFGTPSSAPSFAVCGAANASITFTVVHTGSPAVSTGCNYVNIPIAWCGTYNGSGQLVDVTPQSYITVLQAYSGGSSVNAPLAVSVATGSPSTISVTSSIAIDASTSNKGGIPINLLTSFNSQAAGSHSITGTTTPIIAAGL